MVTEPYRSTKVPRSINSTPEYRRNAPHSQAQALNNEAASLIARKEDLPQAITILTKALLLSQTSTNENKPSSCADCSLDACFIYEDEDDTKSNTRHPLQRQSSTSACHEDRGFVYDRPLRVHQTCIEESHYMGANLIMMILFNLAMAHQLLAISIPQSDGYSAIIKTASMEKSLRLYDICVVHAHNNCGYSGRDGLRLKMVVLNNLGEIHRMSKDTTKHYMCQEYMLRVLMFVAHGNSGGRDTACDLLPSKVIDGFYHNIHSSPELFGTMHAGAA